MREISHVTKLKDAILRSRFDHQYVGMDDYISTPKESGYRSLHLKYKNKNKYRPDYDGLQIEIQLRTKLQHIWATAVETM